MKKIVFLIAVLAIISCEKKETAPKDYVAFSGKIINQNSDSIVVRSRTYSKTIIVNEDGTFKDTLKVKSGVYSFFDGTESTNMFLKNGDNIQMTLDTKMFDETAKYTGEGSESSTFLAQMSLLQEKIMDMDNLLKLDSIGLDTKFTEIKKELTDFYNSGEGVDSSIINNGLKQIDPMLNYYRKYLNDELALKRDLPKGAVSPIFVGYENFKGGKTSLKDLRGKYVYVDVWATWCGPCKAEIPALKEIEKKYHGKKIAFVSLSVDDDRSHGGSWEKANENWKKFVADNNLGGIQLFAPEGWKSEFVQGYKINGIPRFILIDPNGKIVTPTAPRPSSDELIKLFDEENI